MDDATIANFTDITGAKADLARQYLQLSDGDVNQAVQLFFESGGVDMGGSFDTAQQAPPVPTASRPTGQARNEPISVDSDEDNSDGGIPIANEGNLIDNDEAMARNLQESDEAMARRLQEEAYGARGGRGGDGAGGMDIDPETGVRRPMARTQETLAGGFGGVGFGRAGFEDDEDLQAAVREQLARRRNQATQRPGVFNQRPVPSNAVWDDADPEQRRENLSRSTGGASDKTAKSNRLAELYRPPFEIMSNITTLDGLRAYGKEERKWILLNIQSPTIFESQVMNRDIWKHEQIKQTVKEHFVFKQYQKNDPQALQYNQFYFKDYQNDDAYPHIAILDPRTGERLKVWSGPPTPKPMEFLQDLHEFLDRWSMDSNSKNPVATRKPEKKRKDIDKMSEEEMMEMAIQSSLNGGKSAPAADDVDLINIKGEVISQMKDKDTATTTQAPKTASPFDKISTSNPHTEPGANVPDTTRIQFRHPAGRVVRRFSLHDDVRRIYEWLKASPLETREGQTFELVFMGKNLEDSIDQTIQEAGLKNGSVMVEFVED